MTILTRYILSEFFKTLFLALIAMVALFVVINFFEKIDEFFSHSASVFLCFGYYFYKLPLIAFHMAPVAFLLSTVITISSFSKSNEIIAMKSSGLSLMRLTGPILSASLVFSLITIVANEWVIPFTTRKANYIFHVEIKKDRPKGVFRRDKIWYRSNDGAIWQIGLFNVRKQELRNISIFKYEGGENLRERVDAARAVWKKGNWIFHHGSIRTFDKSGISTSEEFKRRKIFYPIVPDDLVKIKKKKEEMSLRDLYAYAQKVKREGMDNSKSMVDLHHKIAYPFISLITALIAIPFSLKSARSGGVILSVGLSIILGFSYYFIFSMGISLGYGGTLPPFLAAWGPNLILIAMGLYLILTIDSESLLPSMPFRGSDELQIKKGK